MQSYTDQVPGDDYSQAEALASLREAYHTPAREPATLPQPGSNGSHPEPATVRSTPPEPEGPPVEPAQGGRFLVFDALDALDFDEPIDWVVEGLIAPGSVSTFAGAGGTGKTYSMIDLGVALLTEKQWLDFPVKRTRVLIVDEESGTKRLKRRLGRVMRGHFIDRLNPIQSGDISCISLSLLNLRDPAEAILLQATIEDLGAGVVIIDALIDISGGANENAAEEMHQIYQRLRKIAEDTQAAIIVIHHTSKAGDVRGSTAIKGACDLVVLIDKKEHSNFVNFEVIKARDIEPIKFAAVLNFNDVGQTWLSPAAAQKRDQAMSRPQRWVATYLQEHGPSRRSDIIAEPGTCSDRSASDAIYQLVEKNVIYRTNPEAKTGHGVEAIYALVEPEEEE
jgi:replicative DNA helicase